MSRLTALMDGVEFIFYHNSAPIDARRYIKRPQE